MLLVHLVQDSRFGVLVLHQEVVAVADLPQLVVTVHMLLSLCQLHLVIHTLYVLVVHIVAMLQGLHQMPMVVLLTFREMVFPTSVQKVCEISIAKWKTRMQEGNLKYDYCMYLGACICDSGSTTCYTGGHTCQIGCTDNRWSNKYGFFRSCKTCYGSLLLERFLVLMECIVPLLLVTVRQLQFSGQHQYMVSQPTHAVLKSSPLVVVDAIVLEKEAIVGFQVQVLGVV